MFGIDDAALAIMLSGAISTAAGLYTNKKNRDAQAEANAINWEIARANNATQIEMANTAHQREVRDLRAAGLNPILSAGGNGSSVPTLQSPTLNPVQYNNAFEGLANSAKGLAGYFGQQYRTNLDTAKANLANIDESTKQLKIDNNLSSLEAQADEPSIYAQHAQNTIEKIAALKETGLSVVSDGKGVLHTTIDDWDAAKNAIDLAREGIRSDMKQRSNANWRANLSSFVPFVSPSAVNSARSAFRPSHRTSTTTVIRK